MKYYYLSPERKPCGPHSLDELCGMVKNGQIAPAVLVAREGDTAWRALYEVAAEQGVDMKLEFNAGTCPTCEQALTLLPDGTLPLICPSCGRAFRPVAGREDNLWYNFTLALRQYIKFSGRATRQEYWSYILFSSLASFVPFMLMVLVGGALAAIAAAQGEESVAGHMVVMAAYVLNYIISLFFLLPTYAVLVRRLHDVGWSGKWVLGVIVFLVLSVACFSVGMLLAFGGDEESVGPASVVLWIVAGLSYISCICCLITSFVLCFFDSQRGPNKYGPSRKYPIG